jgi:dienelactone hydrolase
MILSRRDMLAATGALLIPRCVCAAEKPQDARLGKPKTLNDYFPFTPPKTLKEWEPRKQRIREQVLVANGLWPMPERVPLNAVVHSPIVKDGYTIEKVSFVSTPGHYVTGNLYRPIVDHSKIVEPAKPKHPAVLFAHGHWQNGRFHEEGEAAAKKSVETDAEPDVPRAKLFMQAIPANLAKLGFVVFQYDMIGYADSTAIKHILKSGVPHPEGFADAEGELRLQSLMGLQTWNSVRGLDFLESLPDVDSKRMAITGASGGGTQSFLLAAIDDRVAACFPAVMVSTAMQGGCVCENCSLLRVGTGNIELAAAFAPKPMAMSAAKDWTHEIMEKGYPQLQELWRLYGAEKNLKAKAWLEYPHNYNRHARMMMYEWLNEHLQGKPGAVKEAAFEPVPPAALSVYDDKHPRPKDELGAKELRAAMTLASEAQLAKLAPKDAKGLAEFQRVIRGALRAMICDELPATLKIEEGASGKLPGNKTVHMLESVLGRIDEADALPACVLSTVRQPAKAVVWLHPEGKAGLFKDGTPIPEVQGLLEAGYAVVSGDVLGTGALALEKPWFVSEIYSGFTYGYNRSLLAQRVHDALTLIAYAKRNSQTIDLIGSGEFGLVAVLAKAAAGDVVTKLAADLNQFRFENITKTNDPMMLPGAVKYGGLPAFLAACAPGELLVHNHKGTASGKLPKAAYEAAGAAAKLVRKEEKLKPAEVVEWIVK